ncbi:tyrosine-protein phosphatase [Myceligenerans xiligouense]|uniref:Protein tyrosine/serine phosphatase n=1 Tax=Myceligenerans xiligouense TaxID=253184 RepID=A0A3N4YLS2_9MICO|nr:tyrosine-protein phosphatase [Myceligenerans xiligouense]RPF21067.1 protein tyrosine/serine phosphatase [Myceligenerans xiligouense]
MTSYTPVHLDWPGLLNARDLGGMPLDGGALVRERALIRSESLSWLEPDGVRAARAYGTVRVIDLRLPVETVEYAHPFGGPAENGQAREPGVPEYLNLPVQEPGDPEEGPWAHLYAGMLKRRPALFARAVGAIADAPEGPVLVHCAAGKDRTGLVVAFALSLAGAADEHIADDYELTNSRLAPRWKRHVAAIDQARAAYEEREAVASGEAGDADEGELPVWLHTARRTAGTRDVMLDTLAGLRAEYGSVAEYLAHGGLADRQREELVKRIRGEG